MYDNCDRTSGGICINAGWLAVILSVIAGIALYVVYVMDRVANITALLIGALAVIALLAIAVISIVNRFIIKQHRLCCCAKQRAIWFVVSAVIAVVAIGLFYSISSFSAVFFGIAAAFFTLTVLLFLGFYQCFLRCCCNTCEKCSTED